MLDKHISLMYQILLSKHQVFCALLKKYGFVVWTSLIRKLFDIFFRFFLSIRLSLGRIEASMFSQVRGSCFFKLTSNVPRYRVSEIKKIFKRLIRVLTLYTMWSLYCNRNMAVDESQSFISKVCAKLWAIRNSSKFADSYLYYIEHVIEYICRVCTHHLLFVPIC